MAGQKTIAETTAVTYAREHNEFEIRERIIRVEEELKHQRELMLEGFGQMDKRFEQMQQDMNKRFEQVDKHFAQQHQEIMSLHHEIKTLMRWGFGTLLTLAGLIAALLRMSPMGHG